MVDADPENNVWRVHPYQAAQHLERVTPVLQRALERDGAYEVGDVFIEMIQGFFQVWVINDYQAVAVTRIQVFPRFKSLQICWCAGDGMKEWLDDLLEVLETYGREMGCSEVEAYGRRGWVRAVAHRDYEETMTVVRKRLDG